jgi:AcrR family transcriptional regulator
MARNRREIDSTEKRAVLVAVARRLFIADGYDATGMARVAAEAGVAPNTLYWYFRDKDELLIAVLDALVDEATLEYAQMQATPLQDQLLWLVGRLEAVRSLVGTVHARLQTSARIDAWHDRFHALAEGLILAQLAQRGVPEAERAAGARVAVFVVEGLLSHHAGPAQERERIVEFVAARVASPTAGA